MTTSESLYFFKGTQIFFGLHSCPTVVRSASLRKEASSFWRNSVSFLSLIKLEWTKAELVVLGSKLDSRYLRQPTNRNYPGLGLA